ncbi:MAG: ABC transporter ATP-binding protein [Anaerolineales bacterium]|nr:ABC transporter ATP-binding protein [Anaerolineales bacterium]
MDQNPAIQINALLKNYGPVRALRGVNLQVRRGAIFGFLGPNGAGKTTAIRCMLDLIRPDGGTLRVLGLDPQKRSVEVRARTGYLPGELAFDGNLTVEAGLRVLASLRGNHLDWPYVLRLARRIDLDLKPQFKNLSKGNKQKVGVVQALMHRPELLLLDEPTSGLDPLMQQEVLRMVREARDQGATVFFSSHIISEVEELAERVGIIRHGQVAETVEVDTLKRRSLRRARVRFQKPVKTQFLARIPGITILVQDDSQSVLLQIEGEMDALIKALARHPVSEFETERPTLEEIFMAYYTEEQEVR